MKKSYLLFIFTTVMVILPGCKTELDLKNLDKTVELEMGMAVPVGSMTATLGDFLGNEQISHLTINSDGVFQYRDTFHKSQDYNHVDLTRYPAKATKQMNVYEKLQQEGLLHDGKITGNGQPISLNFDIPVSMAELIKHADSVRIDSAWISMAHFISQIGRTSDLPLESSWVNSVTMTLGDRIQRQKGQTITICKQGEFAYDKNIPIDVDQFHVNLMKNSHPGRWQDYDKNTVEELGLSVCFTFTIPSGKTINVPTTSAFRYHMEMQMATYDALWGWIEPSNKMRDADVIVLRDEWSTWAYFDNAIVPFSEPRVDLNVNTKLAGAMVMYGDSMFVDNSDGERRYAMFNGQKKREEHFPEGKYLDPTQSQPGDSITMKVLFDKDPARGTLADMFTIRAEKLGYGFHIGFDATKTPQIRVIKDMSIRADVDITLPMRFNKGLNIQYKDTIRDVNISQLSLDSLIKKSEIIDTMKVADVKLFMKAYSMIPLHVKGVFRAYDANDRMIMDPEHPELPLQLFSQDTISFNLPQYRREGGFWVPTAGETVEIISLNKAKTELMPLIKKISFVAAADTKDLNATFEAGMKEIKLTPDQSMKIHIGLTGQMDAIFNFNDKKNNETK